MILFLSDLYVVCMLLGSPLYLQFFTGYTYQLRGSYDQLVGKQSPRFFLSFLCDESLCFLFIWSPDSSWDRDPLYLRFSVIRPTLQGVVTTKL